MSTFYDEIYELKNVLRKGWMHYGVTSEYGRYESDAEHTFSMCMLAMEIMEKEKLNLDQGKVYKLILVHELGEIDFGDLIHVNNAPEKEKIVLKQKFDGELNCVKRLAKQYNLNEIEDLWLEFENASTPEAIFAKEMDRLDAVKQSKIYAEKYGKPEVYTDFYSHSKNIADKYKKYL